MSNLDNSYAVLKSKGKYDLTDRLFTASFDIRARRRYLERKMKGDNASFETIKEELMKRDTQDSSRALAPLRPAKDAIIIDTTHINAEEVVNKMLFYIENC